MSKAKVTLGRRGETLAAQALERHGFTIVTRNWRCPQGEVDLVAQRHGEWYFVEVRTRRGTNYGTPEETLTPRKLAHMEATARSYLGQYVTEMDVTWHLSFVAVALDRAGHLLRITIYPDLDAPALGEGKTFG